ncbi:MAG: glycosyltransferase [Clostridiales bacterium]|nr:glycosyltransferase [Clostridiales bacterium]
MISVVIPAYNSESTIVDCIHGVLNQTAIDKIREIIVVDDGSKDGTVEVVKSSIDCDKVRVVSMRTVASPPRVMRVSGILRASGSRFLIRTTYGRPIR